MSAVRLDAPPGLISGSPIFLFQICIWLFHNFSTSLNFNCVTLVHHLLFNSCSAFLCVLPESKTTWASCSTSELVQNVCRKYTLFARLPLSDSSFCWIVRLTPQHVFIAPVGVTSRNSSVRSSLTTKTPHIHLFFNFAHPLNGFGPNKFLPMAPLLQCSPLLGYNDKAFTGTLT